MTKHVVVVIIVFKNILYCFTNPKKTLSSRHEPHPHIPAKIPSSRYGGLPVLLQRAGG